LSQFLILGAGFTGSRVAQRLAAQGHSVLSLHRTDIDFTQPQAPALLAARAPADCTVLHSVPSLPRQADAELLSGLAGKARRVVYLSTTGVYGATEFVDELTPIAPRNERELARAHTEAAVQAGPWESLILRPAAIYGPHRGVHVSMAQGQYTLLGSGDNYISRIHVEDLANLCTAALLSKLTGAYPVADAYPCPSREIAEYCSQLLHLPPPVSVAEEQVPLSRRTNRRIDARAIFRLLNVPLLYPTYKEGIAQCLAAERMPPPQP
jgi:nucleoside-diphosphate-sugar epimerase